MSEIGGLAQSMPQESFLKRIEFQIKVYEDKLNALKILRSKVILDPELEEVIVKTKYIVNN